MLNIAIIEDNADFALVLKCHLESFGGFRVCGTYRMAEEALAGLRKHPVDIAILDISLYRSNGMDVLRKMSPQMSSIQYLVLTMHEDDETIFSALRAGAHGYLLKDAHPDLIVQALHTLAAGGSPMSAFIYRRLLGHFHQPHPKVTARELLSLREKEIMDQISRGLLYKEIASQLGIGRETVKKHLSRIYGKLNVQNKIEALNKYFGH